MMLDDIYSQAAKLRYKIHNEVLLFSHATSRNQFADCHTILRRAGIPSLPISQSIRNKGYPGFVMATSVKKAIRDNERVIGIIVRKCDYPLARVLLS